MLSIEARLEMVKEEKVLVSWLMIMAEFMRVNGLMIEGMERDLKDTATKTLMKEISLEVKRMEKEFIDGKMEKYMKVNGSMVKKMEKDIGEVINLFINVYFR